MVLLLSWCRSLFSMVVIMKNSVEVNTRMFLDIYRQKLDELSGGQFNEQMTNVMIGVLVATMAEFAVQVGE